MIVKNLTNNEGKRSRTDEQLPSDFHGETAASRYAVTRLYTISSLITTCTSLSFLALHASRTQQKCRKSTIVYRVIFLAIQSFSLITVYYYAYSTIQ